MKSTRAITALVVLYLIISSPATAQELDSEWRSNLATCAVDPPACGATVELGGGGPYYGVDNQSANCPDCITGRVVARGYSDAIPVPATRPPTAPPDDAGAAGAPPADRPEAATASAPGAPSPAQPSPVASAPAPAASVSDDTVAGQPGPEPGGPAAGATPVCPTAPTPREVAATVADDVPAPSIGVNPDPTGVTGLRTWLWHEGPTRMTTTTSVRGFRVTTTARAGGFWWDTGDPAVGLLRSDRPGSHASPAATHLYETKGVYRLRAGVAWGAAYRYAGCAAGTGTLPPVTVTSERAYRVVEIRSVLTG